MPSAQPAAPIKAAPSLPPSVPVISVYNRASTPLGLDLAALVPAMQKYVDYFLMPVWGCSAVLKATEGPVPGTWGMVFLDDADSPGALAYHDEESGLPLSKVFVRTIAQAKESLSAAASHELAEMLRDPDCNLYALGADGVTFYAAEIADAVEEESFPIDGFAMSDFVYPCWFDATTVGKVLQFSQCRAVTAPFALARGGYAITCKDGNFSEVMGSAEKAERFALEDRRGHRSEYRRARAR